MRAEEDEERGKREERGVNGGAIRSMPKTQSQANLAVFRAPERSINCAELYHKIPSVARANAFSSVIARPLENTAAAPSAPISSQSAPRSS